MAKLRPSLRIAPVALLLALALLMRVVVPQGMMVQESESAGIEIAICNSDATLIIPVNSKSAPHEQGDNTGSDCTFAGHGGGDVPPPASISLEPRAPAQNLFAGYITQQAAIAAKRQRPPARAPPALI